MKSYLQFISEAKEPKPVSHSLRKMSNAYGKKYPGVNADATETKSGDIHVRDVFLPTDKRNKGIGGRIMRGYSAIADKSGKKITLQQSAEKGQEERLNKFYKSHGFKPNRRNITKKHKDLSSASSYTHIRNPKTKE